MMRRFSGSGIAQRANFSLRGTLNGSDVRVPVVAGVGMMTVPLWEQEPWLNPVLACLLRASEGAFVDVGVNLGQTLLKVRTLAPGRPYIGFEPNPLCVAFARRLIAINAFRDAIVAPFGLSDAPQVLQLFAQPGDPVDSSATVLPAMYTTQDDWERTPVAVVRGDDALASMEVGRVGVIKVDVEGAELEVLRGLEATLSAHRPSVLCEILPSYSHGQKRWSFRQPRVDALVTMMQAAGYRLFRLLPGGGVVSLDAIDAHSDSTLTNYAFVQPEAVAALMSDGAPFMSV